MRELLRDTMVSGTGWNWFSRPKGPQKFVLKRLRVWSETTRFILVDVVKEPKAVSGSGVYRMMLRGYGVMAVEFHPDWMFEPSDQLAVRFYEDPLAYAKRWHLELEIE